MSNYRGWIGVDFDGTISKYDGWKGSTHTGEPIELMAERVRKWIAEGREVRIFTARISPLDGCFRAGDGKQFPFPKTAREKEAVEAAIAIMEWTKKHFGAYLPVTNVKDYEMHQLWDDRAIQVITNTGEQVTPNTNITEPEWGTSESDPNGPWKNRSISLSERLEIADLVIANYEKKFGRI